MKKLIIGIDFGTSTTVVRYKLEGSDTLCTIKDSDGRSDIIPSVIFKTANREIHDFYGNAALARNIGGDKGELITDFKIKLISTDPRIVEEGKNEIKDFLKYVYTCFREQTKGLEYSCQEIYVSYPAKWSSSMANFMKEAVREAGFDGTVHGVFEPMAAVQDALHTHLNHLKESKMLTSSKPLNVFMLDMGAGTSDIYIFSMTLDNDDNGVVNVSIKNGTTYPTVDNPSLCGGREIDRYLQEMILKHLLDTLGLEEQQNAGFIDKHNAKSWKEEHLSDTLKSSHSAGLPSCVISSLLPLSGFLGSDRVREANAFNINRASFEEKTKKHWENLYGMICSAMDVHTKAYGIEAADIDLILLTGGHSSWYTVPLLFNGEGLLGYIGKDYIRDGKEFKALHFDKIEKEHWRIFADSLPHESVAKGLVLQSDGIKVPMSMPNNVWVRLRVNDRASDYVKVISAGSMLPIESEQGKLSIHFDSQRLTHVYDVYIDVMTGKELKTASRWVRHLHFDDRMAAVAANVLGLGIGIVLGFNYDFLLKYKLSAGEDGIIHFESKLQKDNEAPIVIKF